MDARFSLRITAMREQTGNPGVWIPPPLLYAAPVVVGWLLDRWWSLPIGGDFVRPVVGWILVAGFLTLMGSAIGSFRRNRTTVFPFRPATTLVIAGPYRYTRNPMYLGAAMLVLALGCWLDTWWPILLLIPTLVIIQRYVIRREERYMRRRFGAEYDAYARQVRRWI
jgi:protein-S-isoprenylcysteine O-methyltransferase Ste14